MRQRIPLLVAIVAAIALASVTVYLFTELSSANDTLATTRDTLGSQIETNTALQGENSALQSDKAATEAANATLTANLDDAADAVSAWEDANATLTANLDDALGAIDDWGVAFADKEKDLAETNEELAGTKAELSGVSSELTQSKGRVSELTQSYAALQSTHSSLRMRHTSLQSDLDDLRKTYGNLESLEQSVADLEAEIARLRAEREPLILSPGSIRKRGAACTGSMEPKLTCLDEMLWLYDFDPADIVVGASIAYDPGCYERDSKTGQAARSPPSHGDRSRTACTTSGPRAITMMSQTAAGCQSSMCEATSSASTRTSIRRMPNSETQ